MDGVVEKDKKSVVKANPPIIQKAVSPPKSELLLKIVKYIVVLISFIINIILYVKLKGANRKNVLDYN